MIGSEEVRRRLMRRVPEGVKAVAMTMVPHEHSATGVTYRARMPHAGTVLGVHLPDLWPRQTQVTGARWLTGENAVVRTLDTGVVPASVLRIMKFWGKASEMLEIKLAVAPTAAPNAPRLAKLSCARPVILIVRPAESGFANAVRWVSGGLARLGRAASVD